MGSQDEYLDLQRLKQELDGYKFDFSSFIQPPKRDLASFSTGQSKPELMGYSSPGVTLSSPKAIGSGISYPESSRSSPSGMHGPIGLAASPAQALYGPTTRSYSSSPAPGTQSQYSASVSGNAGYPQARLADYGGQYRLPAQTRVLGSPASSVLPPHGLSAQGSPSHLQDLIFNSIEEYLEKRSSFGTSTHDLQRIAGLLVPQDVHALYGQQEQIRKNIQQKLEAEKKAVFAV